jgi:hypothetical protein
MNFQIADNICIGSNNCNYPKCTINNNTYHGGISSTAFGYHSDCLNDSSLAVGEHATVKTANSLALGPKTIVKHENCIVIGYDVESENNDSVKIGNLEYHNNNLKISNNFEIIGSNSDSVLRCDSCLKKIISGIKFKYETDNIMFNYLCFNCIFDTVLYF